VSVSFLGLGAIGEPMARHLARDPYRLTVWNRTSEKAARFAESTAANVAGTPSEAARASDVVITCLPSSREVEALVHGDDGLLAGFQEGSLLIDCTSGDPATSRSIAAALRERGVEFVDAPVSGGVKGAESGTLTVMCGGETGSVERARPILEAFGKRIVHCGPVGAGHAVKAMNQALLAVNIWAGGEALATLARLGVDAGVALDVINGSSGRSNVTENLFTERVVGRKYPRTFKLALLDKDVSIAAAIAEEENVPSPFVDLAARLFKEAHAELGEEADHVEAVLSIERRAGVRIS
jgi:3-hydroxyisobutyrate dehydrogenase